MGGNSGGAGGGGGSSSLFAGGGLAAPSSGLGGPGAPSSSSTAGLPRSVVVVESLCLCAVLFGKLKVGFVPPSVSNVTLFSFKHYLMSSVISHGLTDVRKLL